VRRDAEGYYREQENGQKHQRKADSIQPGSTFMPACGPVMRNASRRSCHAGHPHPPTTATIRAACRGDRLTCIKMARPHLAEHARIFQGDAR